MINGSSGRPFLLPIEQVKKSVQVPGPTGDAADHAAVRVSVTLKRNAIQCGKQKCSFRVSIKTQLILIINRKNDISEILLCPDVPAGSEALSPKCGDRRT